MKIKLLTISLIFSTLYIGGCAISPSTELLQEFKPESKTIVFLNASRFSNKFRSALSRHGFKVKKYASIDRVKKKNEEEDVSYNQAEARYGIELHWDQVDYCLIGNGKKINAFVEVVDLQKNEVVLLIERGGWTETCALTQGTLFKDIAEELNSFWE
tara:strand:+ start:53 stop:523 length:471 start_codon:yes stop_codon:yes gene_type:complete